MGLVRFSLPAAVAAVALTAGDARADAPYALPVYVTVVGTGSVRLRVAAGYSAPCDSMDDVRLVDGWVAAGQTLLLQSPAPCICEQHTYGAFRETNYTSATMICQGADPITGVPYAYITMTVSTDG